MGVIEKRKGSALGKLLKALWNSVIIFFIPGVILTSISPSFTIELSRTDQGRVDASVVRNILLIIPTYTFMAANVNAVEASTIDGGVIREGNRPTGRITGQAEDDGLLLIKSQSSSPIEVWVSPTSLEEVGNNIRFFINESKEPSLGLWVVSNWKFGAILPGAILLFSMVNFIISVWQVLTGKSWEQKSG